MHQFYKIEIDLGNYQYREIPQAIIPYEQRFEKSLFTEIKRGRKEKTVRKFNYLDCEFGILRPKNQIKGWICLGLDGELRNLYVSKWFRNQDWGENLIYWGLNKAFVLEYPKILAKVDIWNDPAKACFDKVLERISCKTSYSLIEE